MKIAICFSGQTRVGKYAIDNIKNFIGDCWEYTDFFVHTWNVNTFGTEGGIIDNREDKIEIISADTIEDIFSSYSPKKLVIENFTDTFHSVKKNFRSAHAWQFISWHRSIQLKSDYETENKFIYDIVIKLRPDVIFHPTVKLIDLINHYISCNNKNLFISNFTWKDYTGRHTTDDIFFLSNSPIMDIASSWWTTFTNLETNVTVNMLLTNFIIENGIDIRNYNYPIDMNIMSEQSLLSLLRYETIKYDPILEFDKCREENLKLFFRKQ